MFDSANAIMKLYGITPEDFQKMRLMQGFPVETPQGYEIREVEIFLDKRSEVQRSKEREIEFQRPRLEHEIRVAKLKELNARIAILEAHLAEARKRA